MSRIVSIHSHRGGTGKSNTTANISALLAMVGYRVGVVDTDIQSPGLHVLFGLEPKDLHYSLNDYLWENCQIADAAYDVTANLGIEGEGKLFVIPSSTEAADITRILRSGYDVSLLHDGYDELVEDLQLDILLIDTHPGLNEETLLSIALSDALLIVLRPDYQDYQGTGVTVEVSRKLGLSDEIRLIVNKAPSAFNPEELKREIEATFGCTVEAVLPHSDEMMVLASHGIFVLHFPEHDISKQLKRIAHSLLE